MGKTPEMHSTREGVAKEIKQDRRQARRERKTNNNSDLRWCKKKDTGLCRVRLIISDLFFRLAKHARQALFNFLMEY